MRWLIVIAAVCAAVASCGGDDVEPRGGGDSVRVDVPEAWKDTVINF